MKLEKLPKKIVTPRNIIVFLSIVLVCLITAFVIYKSHAKYSKAYSDDVLKSKIG